MEKEVAKQLIETTFNAPFDEAQFTVFIKNLLNDMNTGKYYEAHGQYIQDSFAEHIHQYKRIGKYVDPAGNALDVLIVEVSDQSKLYKARTSLRNFVNHHLKAFEKDYALAAFYSKSDGGEDWRFSFVKLEHRTNVFAGKIKQSKEVTPAKRFSFLVGTQAKSHTAQMQLLPLLQNVYNNPTIKQIEDAFSIETVTDEFFERYKELFLILSEHLSEDKKLISDLSRSGIDVQRFTKKLLGQIVFLFFLQKKGWLGVGREEKFGEGDKNFLNSLYDLSMGEGKNFFGDYLQPLFYDALARKHGDEGIPNYYAPLQCKIPFLNGGLFEADYDWKKDQITLPDTLFRNNDTVSKTKDRGTGVLDVFNRYNFTIREDEPLEKEVAVDPEMLGKVFENMLEIKERKSKGAFYTPREIVHYMCQESLINFIDNQTHHEIPKKDIEYFIHNGLFVLENDKRVINKGKETDDYAFLLPQSVRERAVQIDEALFNVKICDPAIGSGAFPVGMLHELINAQMVLEPHMKGTNYYQQKKILLSDDVKSVNYSYCIKRHAIEKSIYGVDLDASAVDIARLRLWLSLIVDEENIEDIEALPNLDYKIVFGDSIVQRYALDTPINNIFKKETLIEYQELSDKFINTCNYGDKQQFRLLINSMKSSFKTALSKGKITERINLEKKINDYQTSDLFGFEKSVENKNKIKELRNKTNELKEQENAVLSNAIFKNSFEWRFEYPELLDKISGDFLGFDIVIGNPPYVDIKSLSSDVCKYIFRNFESAENRINLYSTFIERGFRLLNKSGTLTFINPNSMLLNSSYKGLRKIIINSLNLIIKLPDKIFKEAVVETIILQISKGKQNETVKTKWFKHNDSVDLNFFSFDELSTKEWKEDSDVRFNVFINKNQQSALSMIHSNDKMIDWFNFSLGITPYDKYKGHTQQQIANRVFHAETRVNDDYKPLVLGKNIENYIVVSNNISEYIKYGPWLGAPRKEAFFIEPRIVVRQILSGRPPRIVAGYTSESLYFTQIAFSILSKENDVAELKYLCCLLNSEVLNFYHMYTFLDVEKNTFQKILIENCKQFPYVIISKDLKNIISILYDYLCFAKENMKTNLLFNYFICLIESLMYEIYLHNEMISKGKCILQYLSDVKPLDANMNIEAKISIVNSEFERLYDPYHPVRNNVETLDQIEIIRTIKESLK